MDTNDTPPPDAPAADQRAGERRQGDRRRDVPVAGDRRGTHDPRRQDRWGQPGSGLLADRPSDEVAAFREAMDLYKRANRRPFPTWSEVLEVLHTLGYRKVAEATAPPGGCGGGAPGLGRTAAEEGVSRPCD